MWIELEYKWMKNIAHAYNGLICLIVEKKGEVRKFGHKEFILKEKIILSFWYANLVIY